MSRAFVKESDNPEPKPERILSSAPNLVTSQGLTKIRAEVQRLDTALKSARAAGDCEAEADLAQDLRYWSARLASARLVEPAQTPDVVRFGVKVTVKLASGEVRSYRIVGEDEADPRAGLVSYLSPLAKDLLGLRAGDGALTALGDVRVLAIES
jgi:transcription elongation GreA/GreB family factor